MIDSFDLTTAAGVTALTMGIVQFIKSTFITPNQAHTGLVVNILTIAVAFGLSFGALILTPSLAWTAALVNGCIATANAMGIYEVIKNAYQATKG